MRAPQPKIIEISGSALVFRLICCKVFNTMMNYALQQRNPINHSEKQY